MMKHYTLRLLAFIFLHSCTIQLYRPGLINSTIWVNDKPLKVGNMETDLFYWHNKDGSQSLMLL